MLAGAVGDALGAGIEFTDLAEIRRRYGHDGVTTFVTAYGRTGAVTDDTQMTLFTAEGLLRAEQRWRDRGSCDVARSLRRAYLRWLGTQGEQRIEDAEVLVHDGWLLEQTFLHHRRAPGTTCVAALRAGGTGSLGHPINDSKGCGGLMRVAPVGLAAEEPFRLGAEAAAITHGHPSGHLAAGALTELVARLLRGHPLRRGVQDVISMLHRWPGHEETSEALTEALDLASDAAVAPETVERLGSGWVAEEALAISVYCALAAADVRSGLLLAVNHSGDSDSTGAIAGNLLGTMYGVEAVPADLIGALEGREVIERLGNDLADAFVDGGRIDIDRYPAH